MYKCAQTFTTDLRYWNRIDIQLKSGDCYKPARATIRVYNTSGFTETLVSGQYQITFGIPIAQTTVIVPPEQELVWVSIVLRAQLAGSYCWYLENSDDTDTMSRFLVSRLATNLYLYGRAYLNGTNDPSTTYVSTIYACSSSTERYLLRHGTIDTSGNYRTSSDESNLVSIE